MLKAKLKTLGTALGGAVIGITGHHYGGKLLSYNEDKEEEVIQSERDKVLFSMQEKIDKAVDGITEVNNKLSRQQSEIDVKKDSVLNEFKDDVEEIVEVIDSGRKSLELGDKTLTDSYSTDSINDKSVYKGIDELIGAKETLNTASNKLQALLDRINGKNHFVGESELKSLSEYLDSLSLLQELAFLHIAYIFTIMFILWNIYSVIFANEIVKYFNIEEKYPRWNKFFILRKKYQRYYLVGNLVLFILFSLFILGLDLLTLFVNVK